MRAGIGNSEFGIRQGDDRIRSAVAPGVSRVVQKAGASRPFRLRSLSV
ncbi:hypothetical protein [Lysobacter gummosus]